MRGTPARQKSKQVPLKKVIAKQRTRVIRRSARREPAEKPVQIPPATNIVQQDKENLKKDISQKSAIIEINKKYINGIQIKYQIPISGCLESLSSAEASIVKLFQDDNLCSIEAKKFIEEK